VEQLSEEVDSLKETLDRHSLRQKKRILEAKERAELFERAVIIPLSNNAVFSFPV
jgi:golgi SNAP receptor complex member 2